MKKQLKLISYISVAAVVVSLLLFGLEDKTIYETQKITAETVVKTVDFRTQIYPEYYTKIDLESMDDVKEVFVKKGDKVAKGDILVQLDDTKEKASYNSVWNLYNQLAKYRDEIRKSKIDSVANFQELQQELNNAEVELKNLIAQTDSIDEELQNTLTEELSIAIESLSTALESAETSLNSYDVEQLVQSAVNATYSQVESAKEKVEARKIKAPFDGTVLHIQTDKYVKEENSLTSSLEALDLNSLMEGMSDPTSFLSSGLSLGSDSNETDLREENFIVFSNLEKVYLYTDFSEKEILNIAEGMSVDIYFESSKEKTTGKVEDVMNFPLNDGAEEPRYGIVISIDEMPEQFLIGSNISGSIKIYEQENVLTAPISAVSYTSGRNAYVYQLDSNKELTEKMVVIGNEIFTKVEVLEGLEDGDEIVVDEEKVVKRLTPRPWIKNLLNKQ